MLKKNPPSEIEIDPETKNIDRDKIFLKEEAENLRWVVKSCNELGCVLEGIGDLKRLLPEPKVLQKEKGAHVHDYRNFISVLLSRAETRIRRLEKSK